MLRKLIGVVAAVGLLGMVTSTASAGILLPLDSQLSFNLGALPTVTLNGTYQFGGWATLTNGGGGGHDLTDTASLWNGQSVIGTSLLTGVALLDRLTLTAANKPGSFTSAFSTPNPVGGNLTPGTPNSGTLCPSPGCLGGSEGLSGQFILGVGAINIPFPLSTTGGGGVGIGGTATLPALGILVTNAPFITGKARITAITTNVIQVTGRPGGPQTGVGITLAPAGSENVRTFTTAQGFLTTNPGNPLLTSGTVTLGGTNVLASASAGGMVTLISPLRVNTGSLGVGVIPGVATKKFVFVPEPGTVLLLVSGAAGLIFIGRKRMKS